MILGRSIRILKGAVSRIIALAMVVVLSFLCAVPFADAGTPECVYYFRSLKRIFSISKKGNTIEVVSPVKVTEIGSSMWADLAAQLENTRIDRESRILLRDKDGQTIAFGKFANSKTDFGYFIPFIENGASGKREVAYHALDNELDFGLTGRTVMGKISGGEKISLAEFHRDAVLAGEIEGEFKWIPHHETTKSLLETARRVGDVEQARALEDMIAKHERKLSLGQIRAANIEPSSFQKMSLMDIILGQTDRHELNWMVDPQGGIKAIDNARILGTRVRFELVDRYLSSFLPKAAKGKVDEAVKSKILGLTPDRLDAILKENKIPMIYRLFAKRNLKEVQVLLRRDASFEEILNESAKVKASDYIPMAIVLGGYSAGLGAVGAGTYYLMVDSP